MSWFFSLGISMWRLFVLSKNALESRCRGLFVSVSRCRVFLVLESRCRLDPNNVRVKNKVFPLHNFLVTALHADFIHPSLEKPLSMANLSF